MDNTVQGRAAQSATDSADDALALAWQRFDAGDVPGAIALAQQAIASAPQRRSHADAALGWFLLSLGQVDAATAALTDALSRNAAYAPLHWYLGLTHLAQGRKPEACTALATAVQLDSQLDEAAVSLAWTLGDQGRYAEAAQYAEQALVIQENADRHALLGWLMLCLHHWERARIHLQAALAREPQRAAARSQLAVALHAMGNSEQALQQLADGLVLAPQAIELLVQKIRILLDQKRTEEARATCHQLLVQEPQSGAAWYLLSLVLLQRQRRGPAKRALARAGRLAPDHADVWCQMGWLALEDADSDAAQQALARVLALAPDALTSHLLAVAVFLDRSDLAAAAVHAEKAIANDHMSAEAWRALARVRAQQDRLSEAREALHRALDLEPDNASDSYQQLGWLSLKEHRHDEAIAAFCAAVDQPRPDAEAWYGLAEAYHSAGQTNEALHAVTQALQLRPDWPSALLAKACILMEPGPGDAAQAVVLLEQALSLEPTRSDIRCHLAQALGRMGQGTRAMQVLMDGLVVAPHDPDLMRHHVKLLLDLRRTADARQACHRLIQCHPAEGRHWHLLALVHLQRKRPTLAALTLKRARRLTPGLPLLWSESGWLAVERGDLPTARACMDQLLALAPDDSKSEILAAAVLEASGDLVGAAEHAQRSIARAPRSSAAWRSLAQVCARQGQADVARQALQTAIELEPDNTFDAYRQLGWLSANAGDFDDAVLAFKAAVQNNAKDAPSWYGLAHAYRSAGKFVEALRAIKPNLALRQDWGDQVLRGQIIHQQVYACLNTVWHDIGGAPQARHETGAAAPAVAPANYDFVVCSLSTKSHVPLLNTFARSVQKHHAGRIYLLVVDSEDASLIPEGTTLVRLQDVIAASAWAELVARYNILELCCVLKSYLMRHVASLEGAPILYMDADTYALAPLTTVLPDSPDFSVLLTPHLLAPEPEHRNAVEIGMLSVGVYNGGVIGVGQGKDRMRFLDWWRDRVTAYAYDSREQGVFTDQKWLDLVPSYFSPVHISREPGFNLGHWRVHSEHDFEADAEGRLCFCGVPVTLLHMSGFKTHRPDWLAQHLRPGVNPDGALGQFLRRYASEVIQNRV